ncbi:hypothetical protein MWU75_17040 [Ornithinimicrobium sp. F0845]|uniref:hypothetical protein n=1 Tax=Ornithinimicrobium sp. F0845 TaxID=2926412 RepID=UPI001FF12C30|nr:hypothetical protein [Ornithinimicrobium sp. F0845]MCK0113854.1 hypothetical protein [Ornithinimicrobium sp. F0845]
MRIATTSLTRAARPVTALAVGALVLTGCGMSGSTAAVVDGEVITVKQLQAATADFNQLPVTPVAPTEVLTLLIYRDAAAEAYAGAGNPPISESQVITQLRGAGIEEPSQDLVDLYRTIVHLQGAGDVPSTEGVEIEVNPRFGTWDAEARQVMAESPSWITEVSAEVQN